MVKLSSVLINRIVNAFNEDKIQYNVCRMNGYFNRIKCEFQLSGHRNRIELEIDFVHPSHLQFYKSEKPKPLITKWRGGSGVPVQHVEQFEPIFERMLELGTITEFDIRNEMYEHFIDAFIDYNKPATKFEDFLNTPREIDIEQKAKEYAHELRSQGINVEKFAKIMLSYAY